MKGQGGKLKKPVVELSKQQADEASRVLKRLIEDAIDTEIGQLQAAAVLDALLLEIGPYVYNKAIQDVQEYLSQRFEIMQSDIWALEK